MPIGQGQELLGIKKDEGSHTPVQIIREIFYGTGKTLYQLFREASPADKLDIQGFYKVVSANCNKALSEEDVVTAFQAVCGDPSKDTLTYQEFQEGFRLAVPTPGSLKSETKVI